MNSPVVVLPVTLENTAIERRIRMLRTAMGPIITQALEDPEVVEVLLNPDGSLWLDKLGSGRAPVGISMTPADAERIIRLVAAHVRAEVHAGAPILSAELPETGERFEGVLPPVVKAPAFAIRKRAVGVIRLDHYVTDNILTAHQADFLKNAVRARLNILIETLALYISYFLTVSAPVPEAQQEAARAQGRLRFQQFIEQLGRNLMRGRSLVKDIQEEVFPDAGQFFAMDDPAAPATSKLDDGGLI